MNHFESTLLVLTVAFESTLCLLVFANRVYKILPFFAAYATALLVNTVIVWLVYGAFGFQSLAAYFCFWISLLINAGMRSLAITELCRHKLRGYRGIWRLVWRLLAGISALFILHAAFDAWGQVNRLAIYSLTLDRDLDIASVVILGTLLLIHNYYGLSLESFQRTIAAGVCFICLLDAVGDTIVKTAFVRYLMPVFSSDRSPLWFSLKSQYDRIAQAWSAIHLFGFMAALGIWSFAVRKPIAARQDAPVLLPAGVYEGLSPAINLRLSAFNNRLLELLKS